ncbi:MAG: hypothetical protein RQ833_01090 [Sphingomonadaceae bacterium]|nr:hypothetical protein [Sphingomonadaceae bacterium]
MRAAIIAASLALAPAAAAESAPALAGDWVVDLSTPDQPTYSRPMQLTLASDGTVSGLFYQSPIEAGRWKTDRGRTCASFRTHGGEVAYHTSVCLVGAMAQGQTWAEQRNFLFNWSASRAK